VAYYRCFCDSFYCCVLITGSKGDAAQAGAGAAMGCGYVILQIFFALLGLFLLFKIGAWLFG